ncbi:hypothetical protein A8H29_33740 [Burkholderia cenocepacia]|nr:hypothetical protein [Pseudomonas aeruginosa]PNE62202.1 hypothetical protein A8H29_33740 [Burkholderia cenocepacia]
MCDGGAAQFPFSDVARVRSAHRTRASDKIGRNTVYPYSVRRETGRDQGVKVPDIARTSDSRFPRVMRGQPRGGLRSVDRGADRPAIEPRNGYIPEC